MVKVKISSVDRSYSRVITLTVIPDLTGGLKARDWNKYKHSWLHMADLEFPKPADAPVNLILGGGSQCASDSTGLDGYRQADS